MGTHDAFGAARGGDDAGTRPRQQLTLPAPLQFIIIAAAITEQGLALSGANHFYGRPKPLPKPIGQDRWNKLLEARGERIEKLNKATKQKLHERRQIFKETPPRKRKPRPV